MFPAYSLVLKAAAFRTLPRQGRWWLIRLPFTGSSSLFRSKRDETLLQARASFTGSSSLFRSRWKASAKCRAASYRRKSAAPPPTGSSPFPGAPQSAWSTERGSGPDGREGGWASFGWLCNRNGRGVAGSGHAGRRASQVLRGLGPMVTCCRSKAKSPPLATCDRFRAATPG